MWRLPPCETFFTAKADLSVFESAMPNINFSDKNTVRNEWQLRYEKCNLTKWDALADLEFNIVLWHGLLGSERAFLLKRRSAFIKLNEKEDNDG